MTIRNLYPDTVPSLLLDFANAEALDPRVSFTRSSGAVVVDDGGVYREVLSNAPRFEHNPSTRESLGLLFEEQRTNTITNPRCEGTTVPTSWTIAVPPGLSATYTRQTRNGVQGVRIAISGTTSSAQNFYIFMGQLVGTSGTAVTFSTWVQVDVDDPAISILQVAQSDYNVNTYLTTGSTNIHSTRLSFERRILTRTLSANTTRTQAEVFTNTIGSGVTVNYAIFIGWPQLEQGTFATSPILPPVGSLAAATRAADFASMSGTNFSSWFRADEGTLYSESTLTAESAIEIFPRAVGITDGTLSNTILILYSRGPNRFYSVVATAGTAVSDLGPFGITETLPRKGAIAYRANDFAFSTNGAAAEVDTSGALPVVDRLLIGFDSVALNGTVRKVAYYPYRMSNVELQALTR